MLFPYTQKLLLFILFSFSLDNTYITYTHARESHARTELRHTIVRFHICTSVCVYRGFCVYTREKGKNEHNAEIPGVIINMILCVFDGFKDAEPNVKLS